MSEVVRHPAFVAAFLVAALAVVFNLYRAARPSGSPVDTSLDAEPPRSLHWQVVGGSHGETRLADGTTRDPAFAVIGAHGLVFDYERRSSAPAVQPWLVAPLDGNLRSPCLQFSYVPHKDARVAHLLGFASSDPLAEEAGWAHPRGGVAMWLWRSAANASNSTVGLVEFVDGAPRWLANTPLPFQLSPGHEYACKFLVEGSALTATVSDGAATGVVTDRPSRPLPTLAQVFVADFEHGVSTAAPPGQYRLRFDGVTVTDHIYRVTIDVRGEGHRGVSASAATLLVAVHSTPSLNAAALDESSIRLDGVGVRRGGSAQGYACRAEDVDRDGTLDMLCEVDAARLALRPGRHQFTLEAETGGPDRPFGHRVAALRGRVSLDVDR